MVQRNIHTLALEQRLFVDAVCKVTELLKTLHEDESVSEEDLGPIETVLHSNLNMLAHLFDDERNCGFAYQLTDAAYRQHNETLEEFTQRIWGLLADAEDRMTG